MLYSYLLIVPERNLVFYFLPFPVEQNVYKYSQMWAHVSETL